jgi:hypothetical protein
VYFVQFAYRDESCQGVFVPFFVRRFNFIYRSRSFFLLSPAEMAAMASVTSDDIWCRELSGFSIAIAALLRLCFLPHISPQSS